MSDAGEAAYEVVVIGTNDSGGGEVDVLQVPAWMYDFNTVPRGPEWTNPPAGGPGSGGGDDTPPEDPKEAAGDIADWSNLIAGGAAVGALFTDGMTIWGYGVVRGLGGLSASAWLTNGVFGHIAHDPPQADYDVAVVVRPRSLGLLTEVPPNPLADLLDVMVQVEALGRAFIDGVERCQGARLAHDGLAAFRQLGVASEMAHRLGVALERLATTLPATAAALRALGVDPPVDAAGMLRCADPASKEHARLLALVRTEPGFADVHRLGPVAQPAAAGGKRAPARAATTLCDLLDDAGAALPRLAAVYAHPRLMTVALRRRAGLWSEP